MIMRSKSIAENMATREEEEEEIKKEMDGKRRKVLKREGTVCELSFKPLVSINPYNTNFCTYSYRHVASKVGESSRE